MSQKRPWLQTHILANHCQNPARHACFEFEFLLETVEYPSDGVSAKAGSVAFNSSSNARLARSTATSP